MHGWLVVNQTTEIMDGKKETIYQWSRRSPKDCITDLIAICQSLHTALDVGFNLDVPNEVQKLSKIFDLEKTFASMEKFIVRNGMLVVPCEDRILLGRSFRSSTTGVMITKLFLHKLGFILRLHVVMSYFPLSVYQTLQNATPLRNVSQGFFPQVRIHFRSI